MAPVRMDRECVEPADSAVARIDLSALPSLDLKPVPPVTVGPLDFRGVPCLGTSQRLTLLLSDLGRRCDSGRAGAPDIHARVT